MIEVVPLRPVQDGNQIYLAGCTYDHACSIAEELDEQALRGPARIPATNLATWCHHCAWCGDPILLPPDGSCLIHGEDGCPRHLLTATILVADCIRYLVRRYYADGHISSTVAAHVEVVAGRDWDYWAEAGGVALGELVVAELHPGTDVEDPF